MRTGVELWDIARFSGYWIVGLVLPGLLVFRSVVGSRGRLTEDLALGAVTGIAMELMAWFVAVAIGVPGVVRIWWLPILVLFAAKPELRRVGFARGSEPSPRLWSWVLAFVGIMVVVRFDLTWFRSSALPTESSAIYHDMWWHLSLAHELSRVVPPQIPQLAGEPLQYHFFTHAHMGIAAKSSGVPAELIVFRLAMVPLAVTAVAALAGFVRELARREWAGPLAAWLAFGMTLPVYIWPGRSLVVDTPLIARSPTLIMALPYITVLAWGMWRLFGRPVRRSEFCWLALVLAAASATKPSVIPVTLAGLLVGSTACLLWDRARLRTVASMTGIAVVLQVVVLTFAHGGGQVMISRLVADLGPFNEVADRTIERAFNDGLLLETIDSSRMLLVAALTFVVFVLSHAVWLGGLGTLLTSSLGRSPGWWFIGAVVVAGLFFASVIDHVAGAQIYFWYTVTPIGVALTVAGFARLADHGARRWSGEKALVAGSAAGTSLSFAIALIVWVGHSPSDAGPIERVLFPAATLVLLAGVMAVMWRRYSAPFGVSGLGGAGTLAVIVGLALPAAVEANLGDLSRSLRPVEYPDPSESGNFLSADEAEALYWLADNSGVDDIVASNAWCRPMTRAPKEPPCPNQGFWVAGLTGRRMVLDGYAYTTDALDAHMTDGLTFRNVPLFDERVDDVTALISQASPSALSALRRDHDLRWVVVLVRSGLVSADLSGILDLVFENGSAKIYRVPDLGN